LTFVIPQTIMLYSHLHFHGISDFIDYLVIISPSSYEERITKLNIGIILGNTREGRVSPQVG